MAAPRRSTRLRARALAWLLPLFGAACGSESDGPPPPVIAAGLPPHFPEAPAPAENPTTEERAALGRRLFYEKRLSRDGTISCGSCHLQEHAFADPRRVSEGFEARTGTRNAPGLFNLAWGESFFWDGGVNTLERQVMAPIMDEREMNLPLEEAVARLVGDPLYEPLFQSAFAEGPTEGNLTRALAAFLRTLVSAGSRYDRHKQGDTRALTAAEKRGLDIFFGEAGECFHCHDGFNFTNERYANNGLYVEGGDVGRQRVTLNDFDLGRFKVPSLRNVAVTAPYMHDGSIATLEEVVEHYVRGGNGNPGTDRNIHPLTLSAGEKADLVAFLRALTDESFLRDPRFAPPK